MHEKPGKTRQLLRYQRLFDEKPLAAHHLRSHARVETGGREVQASTHSLVPRLGVFVCS
jgi:hypothetical protein